MSTDIQLIEKPIKYASIAMAIFVVSGYILGKGFEHLALSAFDMPHSSTWDSAANISGLTFDRSVRYFVFYFFSYLSFSCYDRSTLKSSPWAMLILFSIFPAAMSVVPFIFSDTVYASPVWVVEALLLSLLYLGVGHKHPSIILRTFFFSIIAFMTLANAMSELSTGWDVLQTQSVHLFGDNEVATHRTDKSIFWFTPAVLFSVGIQLYLCYWLPKRFFKDMTNNNPKGEQQ